MKKNTSAPLTILAAAAVIGSGGLALVSQAGAEPGGGIKYSECMRANGVADFPDPNPQGQFPYGGVSVPKAVWVKAVDACKNLQPSGWSMEAQRTPEQQDAALKFAGCMRANGVPDFPDPATPQDALIDTSKMRGDVSARDIPELKPAQEACQEFFDGALPGPLGTGRPG